MPFSTEDLQELASVHEVRIETQAPGGDLHQAIVWVVVDGDDVFVRSWLGARARWYREAIANPAVALHVENRRLAATAIPATDPDSVRRCSDRFLTKYAKSKSALDMVRDEILATTLRLEPV
jgi:hypothetical protein